jgi:hypothetical protein
VLHAFLDESGTHADAIVVSVAGFYGSGNQWRTFRKLWKPLSRGFHAKRSSPLFSKLCGVIERSKVNGLLITINKETYQNCASAHMKSSLGNAYAICALLCASSICKQVGNRRVSFVLEQGQPNLPFVKRMLEGLMEIGDLRIAAVDTARKADFIELHTADFLSHVASTDDRHWLHPLFDAGRLAHAHVTEKIIRESCPEITRIFHQQRALRKASKRI